MQTKMASGVTSRTTLWSLYLAVLAEFTLVDIVLDYDSMLKVVSVQPGMSSFAALFLIGKVPNMINDCIRLLCTYYTRFGHQK